jgi:D-glycero-D-manno-heptose 1,7-bisphosphate phosphatase
MKLILNTQKTVENLDYPAGRKAAFLDRDGVINVDFGYVHRREDFDFFPGTLEACRLLHDAGYYLIIITNQAGIARGYYSEEDFTSLMSWVTTVFASAGVPLTSIYYCPHHPNGSVERYRMTCRCRKPQPGMILDAIELERINVVDSILVGDKQGDIEAGLEAGVGRCFLVESNNAEGSFRTLHDVVNHLLKS